MGPRSRELLASVTTDPLADAAFPYRTSRVIDVGHARVRASRISYVGELGWELYVPTEFTVGVFDAVVAAGERLDLRLCGYHALDSLRMEKGYRHWGHDISPDDTPLEAGLGFAVAWDKPGGFTGREALLRQRELGVQRRLVQLLVSNEDVMLYHNEPIWRDGELVGRVTSGAYGHTVGGPVGLGYVTQPAGAREAGAVLDGSYEVEVAGRRVPARASLRPLHDPDGSRLRGTS